MTRPTPFENRSHCWRLRAPLVAAFLLFAGTQAWGGLTISEPVAATDDLPPAPPSHIAAADVPDDRGGSIVVSWVLSNDDRISFVGQSTGNFLVTVGPQSIRRRWGISGYRIFRLAVGQEPIALSEVDAGVDRFVDDEVIDGVEYSYDVRAFDSNNEGAVQFEAGSPADVARTATSRDDSFLPVDGSGAPVLGWFNRADATVGLDDFFLFADHFGKIEGEIEFDVQFDLNADFKIDLGDFFLFADNFGKTVANFADIAGG